MNFLLNRIGLVYVIMVLLSLYGYVANIVKLIAFIFNNDFSDITLLFIARSVGVFAAPLGCILGYF